MTAQAALAAAATLVALAFALSTLERWLARRRRHEAAWTVSLLLFAGGSAALWAGAALGWGEWSFKVFYLFGAILNVPFLALGTVYLLGPRAVADKVAVGVTLAATFCAGWVVAAPLAGPIDPTLLPQGSEVFGVAPRVMAAVGSGVPALVLIGGALWSAVRLLRTGRRVGATPEVAAPEVVAAGGAPPPWSGPSPARLAAANGLIAVGVIVLSLGGLLNSVVGEMEAFAISLVVGISVIFAGFLLTATASRDRVPGWIREALEAPLVEPDPDEHPTPARHRVPDSEPSPQPDHPSRGRPTRSARDYWQLDGPREN